TAIVFGIDHLMHSQTARTDEQKDQRFSPPALSLPKGGGAIRGIGEKFAANPVTGTGSLSIPLPLSPGRSGFTPALALSYDSGARNGPYGFGWTVGYPRNRRAYATQTGDHGNYARPITELFEYAPLADEELNALN